MQLLLIGFAYVAFILSGFAHVAFAVGLCGGVGLLECVVRTLSLYDSCGLLITHALCLIFYLFLLIGFLVSRFPIDAIGVGR